MSIDLGSVGVWLPRWGLTPQLAADVENLGYGALWIGGSPGGDLAFAEQLLEATNTLVVATGIVNMWSDDARTVGTSTRRIAANHPGRFLLGVGIGHPEATQEYQKPYDKIVSYLDELDAVGIANQNRVLAALGPQVLRLAGRRSAGAHPYLTTPEHTRQAREMLGAGPLLAPEHKVVLYTDADRARAIARPSVNGYLQLGNYTSNLRRLGFTDDDLGDGGSDRLIDALALHGDAQTVAAGLTAHLDAGADHVTVQVLTEDGADPLPAYRELAGAFRLG